MALIALFLIGIYVPFAGSLFGFDVGRELGENRALARQPKLSFNTKSIEQYPVRFEAYYNDHFGFRRALIRLNNVLHVRLFNVSPNAQVVMGNEGWLYYGGSSHYFRNKKPIGKAGLKRWTQTLEERRDWLAQRGIHYLFVVAPNKNSIYPEFMPAAYSKVYPVSPLDQLVDYLDEQSDLEILDLRDAFLERRHQTLLYDRTGTHWNHEGAYLAYREIIHRLSAWLPDVKPVKKEELASRQMNAVGRELARMLGLQDILREDIATLTIPEASTAVAYEGRLDSVGSAFRRILVTETKQSDQPRVVIFGDSFMNSLKPFLAEHFSRAVYARFEGVRSRFDPDLIAKEQPNVVLQIMVERNLPAMPVNPPELRSSSNER